MGKYFKKCTSCNFIWKNRLDFIKDPSVKIIGYQVNFLDRHEGFFLFNHICKGTIAVKVENFVDLYKGDIFEDKKNGTIECPEYCLDKHNLKSCNVKCECAFVRDIIQILKK